jgi:prevent-host-death family protein
MTTTHIATTEAKEDFVELLNRVTQNKERVILTRRDKEVAALVCMEDFQLMLKTESKNDLKEATEALQEARAQGSSTLDEIKEELG